MHAAHGGYCDYFSYATGCLSEQGCKSEKQNMRSGLMNKTEERKEYLPAYRCFFDQWVKCEGIDTSKPQFYCDQIPKIDAVIRPIYLLLKALPHINILVARNHGYSTGIRSSPVMAGSGRRLRENNGKISSSGPVWEHGRSHRRHRKPFE